MTAPTLTARVAPTGIKLKDGFAAFYAFALDPNACIWETEVQLPSLMGGDAIDTTTMWNDVYMTKALQQLVEHGDASMTVGYDPQFLSDILSLINQNGSVTCHLPDTSTYTFWGGLTEFEPEPYKKGEFPTANCTIVVTNTDTSGNEVGPVLVSAANT
ncbi:MAG TPA: hypothetical protein VD932_02635 [Aquabacterium sp.]|nr:hypothetical protein [Aquabacterium sp.]